MKHFILSMFLLFSCVKKEEKINEASPVLTPLERLELKLESDIKDASSMKDKYGWIPGECDAMIWNGKLSTATDFVDILAAEYPEDPGRFNRTPPPYCGPENGNSATTWSRDMATCGLFIYAWAKDDLEALKRHAKYGKKHFWKMGSPMDDGRVMYTPNVISLLFNLIHAMGGQYDLLSELPVIFPGGLKGYEAHLEMCDIFLWDKIFDRTAKNPPSERDVTGTMLDRIKEHGERRPNDIFFQYMLAKYTDGDMDHVIDLIVNNADDRDYGNDCDTCDLAQRIFVGYQVGQYINRK